MNFHFFTIKVPPSTLQLICHQISRLLQSKNQFFKFILDKTGIFDLKITKIK